MEEVVGAGAPAAASPAEVARQSHVIITMLPDTADVELVLTGPNGILSAIPRGAVVINMSSIPPAATKRFAALAAQKGATLPDPPGSGGAIGALNATLSV